MNFQQNLVGIHRRQQYLVATVRNKDWWRICHFIQVLTFPYIFWSGMTFCLFLTYLCYWLQTVKLASDSHLKWSILVVWLTRADPGPKVEQVLSSHYSCYVLSVISQCFLYHYYILGVLEYELAPSRCIFLVWLP